MLLPVTRPMGSVGLLFPAGVLLLFLVSASSHSEETTASREETPLTQKEKTALLKDLPATHAGPRRIDPLYFADKYNRSQLVPYLAHAIGDEAQSRDTRLGAMLVLAATRDPIGLPLFHAIVNRPLRTDMTLEETKEFETAMLCLGLTRDEKALDLLFEMVKDAYWLQRCPDACGAAYADSGGFRGHLMYTAIEALAYSGSPRFIEAMESGKIWASPDMLSRARLHKEGRYINYGSDVIDGPPDRCTRLESQEME